MRTSSVILAVCAMAAGAGLGLSQDKTAQTPKPAPAVTNAAAGPATGLKAASDYPVIGYLEKRDRTITIKGGPKGALYTVKTADGKVLCENVSAEQLRAQAPEISEFLKTAVAVESAAKADARVSPGVTVPKVDASLSPR
jgi:hypothetical protein